MTPVTPYRKSFGWALLALWFGGSTVLGAGLLARHDVALPPPVADSRLGQSLATLRHPGQTGWLAVHVLYAECTCSQQVVEHLLETARPEGYTEVVLWVGEGEVSPALARKLDVRRVSMAELAGLGIESAPLLVAMDPQDRVHYAGGYTDRKQGPVNHDLAILASARGTSTEPSLPIFGCAVSDRLKAILARLPVP